MEHKDTQYEVVKSQQGNDLILFNGYTYTKTGINVWSCSTRNPNCKAKLELGLDGVIIQIDNAHCHPPKKNQSWLTERQNRRRVCALLRKTFDPFQDLDETEFVNTFRLGKDTVRILAEDLTQYIPKARRSDGISITTKILTTLAFFATGSHQSIVGQSAINTVSQATVSRAVRQVTEALNKLYEKYVHWPTRREERDKIKTEFYKKFGIPGVLGCIDGTHVTIIKPQIHEERHYNRKGFHSLNVMIICDSNLDILCVDSSNPGSVNDSEVWQNHPLSSYLADLSNNGEQLFLLGDVGYPLMNNVMTPILNAVEGTPQHHYHTKHVAARTTMERCISVLKSRFRCLLAARPMHYDPVTAGKMVNACCVLHNIANKNHAPVPPLSYEEASAESLRQQQIEEELVANAETSLENANPELLTGRALQQALIERLWIEREKLLRNAEQL